MRRERDLFDQISICNPEGTELYKLAFPTTSGFCLHRANNLLAVHAPAGKIAFYDLKSSSSDSSHELEVTALEVTACWLKDVDDFDQVYPPCCQKPFKIPHKLAGRMRSREAKFEAEGLQILCPNCAAKLLFNSYFISVQRVCIEVEKFVLNRPTDGG